MQIEEAKGKAVIMAVGMPHAEAGRGPGNVTKRVFGLANDTSIVSKVARPNVLHSSKEAVESISYAYTKVGWSFTLN